MSSHLFVWFQVCG